MCWLFAPARQITSETQWDSVGKSRNRKRQKAASRQSGNAPTKPASPSRSYLADAWKILVIISVPAGLLFGIDQLFGHLWPTKIDIEANSSSASTPFTFPFTLRNSSALFSTRVSEWSCKIKRAGINGGTMTDINVSEGTNLTVASNSLTNLKCKIDISPNSDIRYLRVAVLAKYQNFVFGGTAQKTFEWISDGEHSKWIEGSE